ncbi:MAG: hypothetical protein KF901_20905 [Myxococcales bacterium]|nr:hypothetical protein [Myxococcales bacterium]
MAKQLSDFVLDKRILERNLKKGLLTQKDLESHIGGLPDRADHAETIRIGPAVEEDAGAANE